MARLAHTYGLERRDAAQTYAALTQGLCRFSGCEEPRVVNHGEVYDFCIRHLMRIDRKIGLAPGFIESLVAIEAPADRRPDIKSDGVVYFMLIGEKVKIGFTTDLKQRATDLRADRVLAYFPGDMHAERTAHDAFDQWRAHGEYFHATPECLAAIYRLTQAKTAA